MTDELKKEMQEAVVGFLTDGGFEAAVLQVIRRNSRQISIDVAGALPGACVRVVGSAAAAGAQRIRRLFRRAPATATAPATTVAAQAQA